jgi:Predicted SAM-dependent methyltransferase
MIILDDRLSTVAALIRRGSLVADVGCDHAYLSIWLVKNNIARHVIASDINDGPLYRAQKNIAAEGVADQITLRRCNGLSGIEQFNPDDIVIAGMGGEQIMSVVEEAHFLRKAGKRLILQPMTRPERLRRALCQMGYFIFDDVLTSSEGIIYQVICAEYGTFEGQNPFTPGEFLLGRHIIARRGDLFEKYLARQISITAARLSAKRSAGHECEDERLLLHELLSYQKRSPTVLMPR